MEETVSVFFLVSVPVTDEMKVVVLTTGTIWVTVVDKVKVLPFGTKVGTNFNFRSVEVVDSYLVEIDSTGTFSVTVFVPVTVTVDGTFTAFS